MAGGSVRCEGCRQVQRVPKRSTISLASDPRREPPRLVITSADLRGADTALGGQQAVGGHSASRQEQRFQAALASRHVIRRGEPCIGKTCPYCQTYLDPGEQVVYCPACRIPHHAECWEENAGCCTFGCAAAPLRTTTPRTVARPPVRGTSRTSNLGTLRRRCPSCGGLLVRGAVRCAHCHRYIAQPGDTAPAGGGPMSPAHIATTAAVVSFLGLIYSIIVAVAVNVAPPSGQGPSMPGLFWVIVPGFVLAGIGMNLARRALETDRHLRGTTRRITAGSAIVMAVFAILISVITWAAKGLMAIG
jgi:hypothetical protein